MPGLVSQCARYFRTEDLYRVLDIDRKASDKEVKKAYHKLSLTVHPDRVPEEEKLEATEKFKVLGKIHSILSDANKRAAYDETGTVDDDDDEKLSERNWADYWRVLFKPITEEDIINYEKEYCGSETELQDLKKAYMEGKGDMDYIVDHVQFARSDQEQRLVERIHKMIKDGAVPAYKIFTHEPERKRKRRHAKEKREAKEVEEIEKQEQEKENGMGDLALMIRQKQQARGEALDSFIDGLAAKYGGSSKAKTKKRKAAPKAAPAKKRKTK